MIHPLCQIISLGNKKKTNKIKPHMKFFLWNQKTLYAVGTGFYLIIKKSQFSISARAPDLSNPWLTKYKERMESAESRITIRYACNINMCLLQNKKKNIDRFVFLALFFFYTESLDSNTQVLQGGKIPINITKKKKKFHKHFPIFTLLSGFINLFAL